MHAKLASLNVSKGNAQTLRFSGDLRIRGSGKENTNKREVQLRYLRELEYAMRTMTAEVVTKRRLK